MIAHPASRLVKVAAIALAAFSLPGCESAPRADDGSGAVVRPAPSYAEVAQRYNERAQHLDRLFGYTVVRATYPDEGGSLQTDQGDDGTIQYIAPDRLALTTGKLGETIFNLGSNAERFWWFDLRRPKRAWIGTHDAAATGGATDFALAIHPLDLIELLSVHPLPVGEGAGGGVAWAPDGRSLLVTLPARVGTKRLALDPATYEPRTIELFDETGRLVVSAELTEYQPMQVYGTAVRPRMPRYVLIRLPEDQTEVRLSFDRLVNRPDRPAAHSAAFDPERLLSAYSVPPENVTNLDAPAAAQAPAERSAPSSAP